MTSFITMLRYTLEHHDRLDFFIFFHRMMDVENSKENGQRNGTWNEGYC